MLILRLLSSEPLHGFGISQRIIQSSRGVFNVNAGSLIPALRRLERAGYLKASWKTTEHNRRAKYYALTRTGLKHLDRATRDWQQQSAAIAAILRPSRSSS